MENLVIMKNQEAVTTSLQVAETFNKNHRDVLAAIDDLKEGVAENYADLFYEDSYIHPQNKQKYRKQNEKLHTRERKNLNNAKSIHPTYTED